MSEKTELFKQHIQKIIYQQLGVKVSKDKAWNLFKATELGTIQFVLKQDDKKLALSGIANFEVLETKPRGSKAGLDKDGNPVDGAKVWPCVPRFRMYPSSVVDKLVEKAYGLGDHDDVELKDYGIYVEGDALAEKTSKKEDKEDTETAKDAEPDMNEPEDDASDLDEI